MNLFETVKTAVNAREAAQLYGVARSTAVEWRSAPSTTTTTPACW